MGWQQIFGMEEQVRLQNEKQVRMARLAAGLFSTPAGREYLEYLREITIEKPTMPNQAVDGYAMAQLSAVREGENNLYRRIEADVKRGKTLS